MEDETKQQPTGFDIIFAEKQRAIRKVVYEAYAKMYKSEFKDDPQTFIDSYLPGHLNAFDSDMEKVSMAANAAYHSNLKLSSKDTVALMVTFSPDPSLSLDYQEQSKLAHKIIKPSKGIKYGIYTIENRDYDELGPIGTHFHALIILNKEEQMGEVSRQVRRIIKLLEKYKTTTTHFLDIKNVSKEKLQDKIDYIKGKKVDPEKQTKVAMDHEWKIENGIPIYVEL